MKNTIYIKREPYHLLCKATVAINLTRYSIYFTTAIRNSIFTLWSFFEPPNQDPMHACHLPNYTWCQITNLTSTLKYIFEIQAAFQKDILIALPIHYSLRIYKWKWIESLDISLESLRLVCGLNIVNYIPSII